MPKVTKQKMIVITLEEQYQQIGRAFKEYLDSLNIPAISSIGARAVLALEVDITDERMVEPVRMLVDRFTADTDIPILPVIRIAEKADVQKEN